MKFFENLGKALAAKVAKIIIVVVLLGGGFLFLKFNPFDWNINFLGMSELKIDDTANVVEKIKKISEFTTACYYEEFVLKNDKMESTMLSSLKNQVNSSKASKIAANLISPLATQQINNAPDSTMVEIVILSKGTVRAGYDLSKVGKNDLKIANDTITINLPTPEIFDVILNPSDYEFFIREGNWSHEEVTAIQSTAKERLLNDALNAGILDKAESFGKDRVQGLFKTFGFNVVNVTVMH